MKENAKRNNMKKSNKIIQEATLDDERQLKAVTHNQSDSVKVRNKEFKVKWMHPATIDWLTSLMLKDGNDSKILSQCAALIVLNGFWKCHLFYWAVWRWFYYVRQYNAEELMPLFAMAQKKTQQQVMTAYLSCTTLLTALKDTRKMMTKEEAEHILQERHTDNDGKSRKSTE